MTDPPPRFVSPGQRLREVILGRRTTRSRARPLDDGSTLELRCPGCAAALRARCGRTNACPRCAEQVTVPGADVARAVTGADGGGVRVRRKLTGDDPRAEVVPGPLLVVDYASPYFLVRLRGEDTAWAAQDDVRVVPPRRA